jgi:predicted HTH domain antitoxin
MKVIKIEGEIYKKAEKASLAQGKKVNDFIKQALRQGLDALSEKNVLDQYRDGRISLQKASELLSVDLWEMIEKIKKAEIHVDYSLEELAEDTR